MRMTTKGQVTIPIAIRERLGLVPGNTVEFEVDGDAVRVKKAAGNQQLGRRLIETLRGRGDVELTTDEIMALTRGE